MPNRVRTGFLWFAISCLLLIVVVALAAPGLLRHRIVAGSEQDRRPSATPPTADLVWTWSKQCNGDHKLGVTVRLSHNVLYDGVLPVCRASRAAEDGRVKFHFASDEYRIGSVDSIEGNLWQAGGEQDALILGISLQTKKEIPLNTTHIANPDKQVSSELDKGLINDYVSGSVGGGKLVLRRNLSRASSAYVRQNRA